MPDFQCVIELRHNQKRSWAIIISDADDVHDFRKKLSAMGIASEQTYDINVTEAYDIGEVTTRGIDRMSSSVWAGAVLTSNRLAQLPQSESTNDHQPRNKSDRVSLSYVCRKIVYTNGLSRDLCVKDKYHSGPCICWDDADDFAQRFLGNIEPSPGESPDEYSARMDRARNNFISSYPGWAFSKSAMTDSLM
jgi:hypothetical protein